MTSKEMRLRDARLYQEAMSEVLTGNDSEIWIFRNGMEMSLGMAMDYIHDYIGACLWMNDNPLRHLRKQFPGFAWKFHEDVGQARLASILGVVDYIWVTGLEIGDGFVTATQIRREKKHRVFCFLSETGEHSGWNNMIRRDLSSGVPGIRFVENGNNNYADTIIS